METTLTALRRDLLRRLREVGEVLDTTRDPDRMREAISQRKRLAAQLAIVEDSLARIRVDRMTRP
jgi:hypothetical protein